MIYMRDGAGVSYFNCDGMYRVRAKTGDGGV